MSIRNLESLFAPRAIAVIGASTRPGNLGAVVLRNLLEAGFAGPVWGVNPHGGTVQGCTLWPDVASLPGVPELAVICTPAPTVPQLVGELGRRGTRAVIALPGGMREAWPEGGTIGQAVLDAARPHLLRVLGPNCLGTLVPGARLNASFAPGKALPGRLAFVTQSGALATAMLDWANAQGIGFSHFVSLGDSLDIDAGDMLDYLGSDAGTGAILMYLESVRQARKFMSAARAAARNKPVILVKAGRAPEGVKAAASHTGALAGSDAVFDAAVRRAGMLRVDSLQDLLDAAQTLSFAHAWCGERLAVVTNGGGAGVLAADALARSGGTLAGLSDDTRKRLDAFLPAAWSASNPVDIIGDAPAERYAQALRALLEAPEVDGVLFLHAPTAIVSAADIAAALVPLLASAHKPVLTSWLGGATVQQARREFIARGQPCYGTPEQAVAAWMQLVHYHRNQAALLEIADGPPADQHQAREAAQAIIEKAMLQQREWLTPEEAARVLALYDVPCTATACASNLEDAVTAANRIGYPVALKILSQQIVHKSDAGGVALNLNSAAELRTAAVKMRQRVAARSPRAIVLGFTVQAMAPRNAGRELIAGIATDPVFGPVVMFGDGGTAVELRRDVAIALPPLTTALARDLVGRTRVSTLLGPVRDTPAADQEAIHRTLLALSQIAIDLPAVAELDINPLAVSASGVLAIDARIRLGASTADATDRLALRPYPRGLESTFNVGGHVLPVRPIRPDDGERLAAFYRTASPHDMRLRFFMARREVPGSELARYCQIDYEREMTFVAMDGDAIAGEIRAVCDPDNHTAEFAIQVAGPWQGRGLGRQLMDKLIDYLRARGTAEVVGFCMGENAAMASLAKRCGFVLTTRTADVMLRLALQPGTAAQDPARLP